MLIYAHRGASAEYPENTLRAFQRAIELGVDGIELDLHASADGVPVVIHDRELERTTNGRGYVDRQALAALQAHDAGRGERIPTLAEVIDLVGDAVHLDLEIKGRGIEAAVLETLTRFPRARWAISSFDWEILRNVRRIQAIAPVWPLAATWSDAVLDVANELESPIVAVSVETYTAQTAEAMRAAGLATMIWTVNDVHQAQQIAALGAFALCTDDPARIAAGLQR